MLKGIGGTIPEFSWRDQEVLRDHLDCLAHAAEDQLDIAHEIVDLVDDLYVALESVIDR